ncbi:MAG: efflux RND transporter periplasmic adaptor subunit [Candidatus Binataceae bacterium]
MPSAPAIETRMADLAQLSIVRSKPRTPTPKHFNWKLPIFAACLTVAITAAWYVADYVRSSRTVVVQTAPAETASAGGAGVMLSGSGYIVTAHSYVKVGTLVNGQIVEEPIEEGQYVRKGDLLARINDVDYRAHLGEANADYVRMQAESTLADQRVERTEQLYQAGIVSREEYDSVMSAQRVAHASLEHAKSTANYAESQVRQCTVRSPLSGVVLRKFHDVGSTINYAFELQGLGGSTDIALLADTDDLRVELDVSESDIAKIHLGMPASITLDAYPDRSFDGTVVKIYPEADRQKASIKVEVRLLHPDLSLVRPEMSAKVNFLDSPANHKDPGPGVQVPAAALVTAEDGSFVWVVNDGRARRVRVETGPQVGDNIGIERGLNGSETVILNANNLAEGERVSEQGGTDQQ